MQQTDEQRVFTLIGSLYEAAQQPTVRAWAAVYSEMASLMHCGPGTLSICFPGAETVEMLSHNMDAQAVREYYEHFANISPFRKRLVSMKTGEVFVRSEVMSDEEWTRTEFYNDYLRRYDVFNYRYEVLFQAGGGEVGITFSRPKSDPYFTAEVSRIIRLVAPHLSRAFALQARLRTASRDNKVLSEAFDQLPQCVFIVDEDHRLVFANRSARDLTERADGFEVKANGTVSASGDARRLRNTLASIFASDGRTNDVFHLPRPSGKRPLEVTVSPFKDASFGFGTSKSLAIMFVSDPENEKGSTESVLVELYSLTPAEARLACLIADGLSLTEIGEVVGITRNTARTHLQKIFSKTGTNRQSELVKLILSGSAILKNRENL